MAKKAKQKIKARGGFKGCKSALSFLNEPGSEATSSTSSTGWPQPHAQVVLYPGHHKLPGEYVNDVGWKPYICFVQDHIEVGVERVGHIKRGRRGLNPPWLLFPTGPGSWLHALFGCRFDDRVRMAVERALRLCKKLNIERQRMIAVYEEYKPLGYTRGGADG